jgi:hypothetical protein
MAYGKMKEFFLSQKHRHLFHIYIWNKCLCSEARYVIESKLFMDNQQFDGSLYMYKVLQHFKFFLHYTFVIPIYFLPQDKFNIVHVPYRKTNLKLFFSETP